MSYTLLSPQPDLQTDELGLTLDDGTLVAVKVASGGLMSNNAGIVYVATCREINADGTSKVCATSGNAVQTTLPFTAEHAFVDAVTDAVIKRELMFAVLGEPQTTHVVDGQTVTILMLTDSVLDSANIRKAASTAAMVSPTASALSSLLGL